MNETRREETARGIASGPVRIALLGYGAIAAMHVPAVRAAGGSIEVVAGPNETELRAFADQHDIPRATTDVEAAIGQDGVRAVVIASPTEVHVAQATSALEAGRHVLVEIPLATSLAEGRRLVALAGRTGLTLAVCHTLRYWEPVQAAHRWMEEQRLQPTHVVARALSLRHANVGWTGRRRTWTDDLLWHHGGHVVDEVLTLLGSPVVDVRAVSGPAWSGSGKPMDHAIGLLAANGAVATIALSYHARISASEYLAISGEETLLLTGADVRSSMGPVVSGGDVASVQEAAVHAQDRDFLDAVRAGRPTAADAWSILPTLAVCQAVSDLAARSSDTMAPADVATNPESEATATKV